LSHLRESSTPSGRLGQSAGLHEQWPRERRDRFIGVEVAVIEHLRDGGGPAGGLDAPQRPGRHELQHGTQVV
jgi:hypothetical protein